MAERPELVNDSLPKPLTHGIKASYPGTCRRCRKPYGKGQLITKFGRGWACCK